MKKLLLSILKFYKKYVSVNLVKLFGNGCRFSPTCSDYSHDAVKKFGVFRGVTLSFKRIIKCHPFSKPGHDPVPTSV